MTFKISENMIKDRKVLLIIIGLMIPIMMTAFFLLSAVQGDGIDNIGLAAAIILGISSLLAFELYVLSKIMFKKLQGLVLNFDEEGFTRVSGNKSERFNFNNMTQVKITKKDGQLQKMIIQGKCSNKVFAVTGFNNMDDINTLFENSVDSITHKRQKIDWTSTFVVVSIMILTFTLIAIFSILSDNMLDYLTPMCQILLGLYLILLKPTSKSSGSGFRIFEYIIGGLLIVLAVYTFIR